MRLIAFAFWCATLIVQAGHAENNAQHITFSLVHGSVGFVSKSGGTMTDAPRTVLSFTGSDRHQTLVLTDMAGDYVAVLQPGHYSVAAYEVKTGYPILLESRQLKYIDVLVKKDVRLDVMLVHGQRITTK